MKEELLKSVAQPMQIFFAPFGLFMLDLIITGVLMISFVFFGFMSYLWVPLIGFVILFILSVIIGKKEPHIDTIIASRQNIRVKTKSLVKENGNKFSA